MLHFALIVFTEGLNCTAWAAKYRQFQGARVEYMRALAEHAVEVVRGRS
jgi:hypothetical protein